MADLQQQPAAAESVVFEGTELSQLLQKEFKPKTDEAKSAVELAVRTLAAQLASDASIGGGCGEADVKREAVEVIRTRKPRTVRVDLLDDISSDSPAVCGGIMNVFIDPWWKERDREAAGGK